MTEQKPPWSAYKSQHVPLGQFGITDDRNVVITTLLGSCVAACIFDQETGIGGLNHFLLPDGESNLLYGTHSMEMLVNGILNRGARRSNIRAKAFGGAQMKAGSSVIEVGRRNCEFVRLYLKTEGFPLISEDLGGTHARRVWMHAASGRVWIERVRSKEAQPLANDEVRFKTAVSRQSAAGDIDLFT